MDDAHVAGPVELEPIVTGGEEAATQTQRCLRCDLLLKQGTIREECEGGAPLRKLRRRLVVGSAISRPSTPCVGRISVNPQ